jgi:putative acetyltransferase
MVRADRDGGASMLEIIQAKTPAQIEDARRLFREYAASLGIDLCFQGFDAELAGLPGAYAPPRGRLLLAGDGQQLLGCVALRPQEGNACEMKRLYVRNEARGRGVGLALAQVVIGEARALGYDHMRLDTLPTMADAIRLYRALGFHDIPAYYRNPIEGALYLELALAPLPSPEPA